MTGSEEQLALSTLNYRLKMLLPEQYQDGDEVSPVSMSSAGLKYDSEGRVAWNEIWGSFCDLAMAGGPPHKKHLLAPGAAAEIAAEPERYQAVLKELGRGIVLVTGLTLEPDATPGWIRVHCGRSATAGWLARAITAENVAVRVHSALLDLPVGPAWRVEKEVKNVVTVIAKTFHYWAGHTSRQQQQVVANLFAQIETESPLLQPIFLNSDKYMTNYELVATAIYKGVGCAAAAPRYLGWLGIPFPDVTSAIWMMRALLASNVLARREEMTLYVPVNPESDPGGECVVRTFRYVHRLLQVR